MPARASTTSTPSRPRSPAACQSRRLLSHDLFEGIFARAGLVSDVEVVEDFPSRYDVAAAAPSSLGARRLAVAAVDSGRGPLAGANRSRERHPDDRSLEDARQPAPNAVGAGLRRCHCSRAGIAARSRRRSGSASSCRRSLLPTLLPLLGAILPRRAGVTSRSHFDALGARLRSRWPNRHYHHLPGTSGMADGRCDRSNAVCGYSSPTGICWNGFRRRRRQSVRGSTFSGFYRRMAGGVGLRRFWRWHSPCCPGTELAPGDPVRRALDRFAGDRALGQPFPGIAGQIVHVERLTHRPCDSSRDAPGGSSRPLSPQPTTCCRRTISRKIRRR